MAGSTKHRRSPAGEGEAFTEETYVTTSDWPLMRAAVSDVDSPRPCDRALVSWSGSDELTTAPTARPRAPSIVFLFGGTHEWSCHGKLLFPAVKVMGGRVRSVALSGGG